MAARVVGQPLRMISRRSRTHSALSFHFRKRQQLVQGSTFLEGACALLIIQLEVSVIFRKRGKCFRPRARRQINRLTDASGCGLDIGESYHLGFIFAKRSFAILPERAGIKLELRPRIDSDFAREERAQPTFHPRQPADNDARPPRLCGPRQLPKPPATDRGVYLQRQTHRVRKT